MIIVDFSIFFFLQKKKIISFMSSEKKNYFFLDREKIHKSQIFLHFFPKRKKKFPKEKFRSFSRA